MNYFLFGFTLFFYSVTINLFQLLRTVITETTEVTTCEFQDLDVFFVANKASYQIMEVALRSFDAFMPCYNHMHVFVDEEDIKTIDLWLPSEHYRATIRVMDGIGPVSNVNMTSIEKYIIQAWLMMWADYYVNSTNVKYIMYFDSDVIFGLPISRATLFDHEGRPYLGSWSKEKQTQFSKPCFDMIGDFCLQDESFMSFFPFTIPIQILPDLREITVAHRNQVTNSNKTFDEHFLNWAMADERKGHLFSQFYTMGNFAKRKYPHLIHHIFAPHVSKLRPEMEVTRWVAPAFHYWHYGMYLGSGGTGYDLSNKHKNPHWLQLGEELVHRGVCLKHYWETGIREGLGCVENKQFYTSLHQVLKLYPQYPANGLHAYRCNYYVRNASEPVANLPSC